ncbi:cysteine-rich repeat secretory protein 9-like [Spinacia oleracea]|uniref:Cysteine-rich repeat secretory protein 9-like n=1 Tax=Spinacia oleracea TaxID=3562 RepID=A0ABM3R149_SPIOL|nr:cysteine-rich repeat secretory protein 9-like [Spinacia oleracea]
MVTRFLSKIQFPIFFIISSILSVNSQLTYINHGCFEPFTHLSGFEANIGNAITQLTFEASTSYYSTNTTGVGEDQVNAFFYCRYDVSPQTCQSCVASAAINITSCLSSVEGIVYYEECILHYANLSFSTIMVELPRYVQASRQTADLETNFGQILGNTFIDLISNVTSEFPVSSRYFATMTAKYRSYETIYAFTQCNPDITSNNCSTCLQNGFSAIATNYTGSVYAQLFSPICRLSYVLSGETLSRPWSFSQTFRRSPPTFSAGNRGIRNSFIGAMIASISSMAMCLKLFL